METMLDAMDAEISSVGLVNRYDAEIYGHPHVFVRESKGVCFRNHFSARQRGRKVTDIPKAGLKYGTF